MVGSQAACKDISRVVKIFFVIYEADYISGDMQNTFAITTLLAN
jgi:hypothetical protein